MPSVALIAMWAIATAVTLGPGLELINAQNATRRVGDPTQALLRELQAERKASLVYLAGTDRDQSPMLAQRAQTDAAASALRSGAGPATADSATDVTGSRLAELYRQLDSLALVRASIDRGEAELTATSVRYTQIIEAAFQVYGSLLSVGDADLAREARALVAFSRAREVLAQEDALISAALAAGRISAADLAQVVQLIGTQRYLFSITVPDFNPADRTAYQTLAGTGPFTDLVALENQVVSRGRPAQALPIDAAAWASTYDSAATQLLEFETATAERLVNRSAPAAWVVVGQILVAGLLGLVTVIITIVASVRIGRSLIKRLAGLRQAALELAVDRLPNVVQRLRRGEEVDVERAAPPLPYSDDEIGQVGHAFNELQRTAVNSAIEEATLRRGLNEVFLNIARRSQTLLHRQLSILDRMERRTDDPTELEDLFRVDHLATRMRRHAEDLVILAGATPGRGWRNPVPVIDVLRGAVSEIEDYARVSIRPTPDVSVVGRAVGDVIHLLAELIENATSFSPPHTRVNLGADVVTHGLAIEIEDRGLGMTADALAECNARLASPPDFDPANSAQLGLFVVSRLAARHGIKVQLRSSAYGGITAVVLLPEELLAGPTRGDRAALPAGHGTSHDDDSRLNGRGTLYRASVGSRRAIGAAPEPGAAVDVETPVRTEPVNGDGPINVDGIGSGAGDRRGERTRTAAIVGSPPPRPRHARQEVIEATATPDGLPRRIRQTNMAPQLRDPAPEPSTTPPPSRSPEEMRAMMSAFQAGTTRGRLEADAARDDSARHGVEGTAP
ncbi:MAG TPA: nitrate- and nitrite sensing domain-containing protein [Micromonosporaceae bacterium]|nr:nitrate- and nitrite sensing domain-containing protein [Micromonosporaceae bacterium]